MSKELDGRIKEITDRINALRRKRYQLEKLGRKPPVLDPALRVTSNFHLVYTKDSRVVYVVIPNEFERVDVVFEAPRWRAYELKGKKPEDLTEKLGRHWNLGGGFGPSPEEAIAGYLQEPGGWG